MSRGDRTGQAQTAMRADRGRPGAGPAVRLGWCFAWLLLVGAAAQASANARSVVLRPASGEAKVELSVSQCDRVCSLTMACPPVLSFRVKKGMLSRQVIYEYEARTLIEQRFQTILAKRWARGAGSGSDGTAEVTVHRVLVEVDKGSATCSAEVHCALRDRQKTVVFKRLFTARSTSPFDGVALPDSVEQAICDAACRFVTEAANDPLVAGSSLGGVRRAPPGELPGKGIRITVLPLKTDPELKMMAGIIVTAFGKLGFEVLSEQDRDRILKEHAKQLEEVQDPDEGQAIELGRMLNSRYLVIGECGFLAGKVTINLRVVDAESGKALGSESVDSVYDSSALHVEASRIAGRLAAQWMTKRHRERRRPARF